MSEEENKPENEIESQDEGSEETLVSRLWSKDNWQGVKLGRYKIESVLGVGGMGRVFLAKDVVLQRNVAVKVIRESFEESNVTEELQMFLREAQAVARLEHPNVVCVYDVVHEEGVVAVAMEYVPGGTLQDLLTKEKKLEIPEACRLVAEAAEGLANAHENGMIHRDIKPANLMLTEKKQCKVVDFGTIHVEEQEGLKMLEGKIVGTPYFTPPEVIRGDPPIPQSDIYSLGIVLWWSIAGRPPYTGKTRKELFLKHLNYPMPEITKVRVGIPRPLTDLISSCLEKDPSKRIGSMAELAKKLREIQEDVLSQANSDIAKISAALGDTATGMPVRRAVGGTTISTSVTSISSGGITGLAPEKKKKMMIIGAISGMGLLILIGILVLALAGSDDKPPDKTASDNPGSETNNGNNNYYNPNGENVYENKTPTNPGNNGGNTGQVDKPPVKPPDNLDSLPTTKVMISGEGFSSQIIKDGGKAFSNKGYFFKNLPAKIEGWYYTQLAEGGQAKLNITAATEGVVYMATSINTNMGTNSPWKRLKGHDFYYTDRGNPKLALYRRKCSAGEKITLLQNRNNKAGTMIIAPEIGAFSGDNKFLASYKCVNDTFNSLDATNAPTSSYRKDIVRFTWWPQKGTTEWIERRVENRKPISSVGVYWFVENNNVTRAKDYCVPPDSWKVLYKDGNAWKEVSLASDSKYGTEKDKYNEVKFQPVVTSAIRIQADLKRDKSCGILRFRLNPMGDKPPVVVVKKPPVPVKPKYVNVFKNNKFTASHQDTNASFAKLTSGIWPNYSGDETEPWFSWYNHKGGTESIERAFTGKGKVSFVKIYWFDDAITCRAPESWKLFSKNGSDWKEITPASGGFGTEKDQFNTVRFKEVETTALKIEAKLQDGYSAGILRWQVGPVKKPGSAAKTPAKTPPGGATAISAKKPAALSATGFSSSFINKDASFSGLTKTFDPANSMDKTGGFFSWHNHKDKAEWLEKGFKAARKISSVSVYWLEDKTATHKCSMPSLWKVQYLSSGVWKDVVLKQGSTYGTAKDKYNDVQFETIETTAIRIHAKLQLFSSAGILRLKIAE